MEQQSKATKDQVEQLAKLLIQYDVYPEVRVGAIYHALLDIEQEFRTIYQQLLPMIVERDDIDKDRLLEAVWDLRESFRHIDYHIHDAELDT